MINDLYLHSIIGNTQSAASESWVRPEDWLTIPDFTPSEDKIYMLIKITEDTASNYLAFGCGSNCTVDWGDGSVPQSYTAKKGNVIVEHQYDFASISENTLTSSGWRQALVTVTPNGAPLSKLLCSIVHSSIPSGNAANPILELRLNCPALTVLNCQGQNFLMSVQVGENSVTDFSYMFSNCASLTSIPLLDTSSGTNFDGMFYDCSGLTSIPLLDTSSGTDFSYMFSNCASLTSIPLLDTSSGTDFSFMFYDSGLTSIPLLDTSSGTDFSYMFSTCASLTSIPLLDTSSGTDFSFMFSSCTLLNSIPLLDTSSGTDFSYMFYGCVNLEVIPALNLSSATYFGTMISYSYNIKIIDVMNISSSLDVNNRLLDKDNLINIFNNLVDTPQGSAELSILNNPGVVDLLPSDIQIATDKGWTVYY